jgi:hypothetical protein
MARGRWAGPLGAALQPQPADQRHLLERRLPPRTYLHGFVRADDVGREPDDSGPRGSWLSDTSDIKALTFRTRSGSTPPELFQDSEPTGPKLISTEITPMIQGRVALNELSGVPVEVRLSFDQPLNPASTNVPVNQGPESGDLEHARKGPDLPRV